MADDLTAVLLPGLDGTGMLFDRFVRRCPPHFSPRVVSYPHHRFLDYRELEDLARSQLPSHGPFALVAESFSGPVGVRLAARPPANLVGLVLAASFVTPPRWPGWRFLPWRMLFRLPAPAHALRRLVSASDTGLLREMRVTIRRVSPDVLAARVRSTLTVDAREALGQVECPVLYVQARRDHVVPARCLRDILRTREDVIVETFDTLHLVLQQEPDAVWEAISRFVASSDVS